MKSGRGSSFVAAGAMGSNYGVPDDEPPADEPPKEGSQADRFWALFEQAEYLAKRSRQLRRDSDTLACDALSIGERIEKLLSAMEQFGREVDPPGGDKVATDEPGSSDSRDGR